MGGTKNVEIIDIVGGIEIIYQLVNTELVSSGFMDLPCINHSIPPVSLILKENEYIASISGKISSLACFADFHV